jgi:predicted dehydrogenase
VGKLKMIQVGSGGWGESWLSFLNESDDWELVGLVSRGGENLARAQAHWRIPESQCFTDLDSALSIDADAVLISAPPHVHTQIGTKALHAGKHVLCEKPFSDSFDAARDLVALGKATGKHVAISQNFRYREGLWRIKAATGGDLGPVDSLTVELYQEQWPKPPWRKTEPSAHLLEIAIHHVDMARFLLDSNASKVFCQAWNPSWSKYEGPASAFIIVLFENGASMSYNGSWAALGKLTSWEGLWRVQCEKGAVVWDGQTLDPELAGQDDVALPKVDGIPGHDRTGVLRDFADTVRDGAPFPANGEDNLQSLAIVLAAIRSFQEEREVSVQEFLSG